MVVKTVFAHRHATPPGWEKGGLHIMVMGEVACNCAEGRTVISLPVASVRPRKVDGRKLNCVSPWKGVSHTCAWPRSSWVKCFTSYGYVTPKSETAHKC